MDGVGLELDHPLTLGRSNKRSFSASSSPSPAVKRARHQEQGRQLLCSPMIHQPTPRPVTHSTVALLENLTSSQPSTQPIERVGDWLEVVYPFELDRERLCRSDEFLAPTKPASSRQVQSAPPMMPPPNRRGQVPTPLPSLHGGQPGQSAGRGSPAVTASTNRSGPLVEHPRYRDTNLAENNIYLRDSRHQLPRHISTLVTSVQRDRESPLPSPNTVENNADLYAMEMEASEAEVEEFFRNNIAPRTGRDDQIKRSDRIPMNKATLPVANPQHKLSNPVPDMLYGYNRPQAFSNNQRTQISTTGNSAVANSEGLLCPFFAIEFKGDGPSSNACVNVGEQLNEQLRRCNREEVRQLDSASFSIAMNGTEARLYISWKQEKLTHMQKISSFILQRPEEFIEFRKYVRNIVDWGRDGRLRSIQSALDTLIEEGRKVASKSRPAPGGPAMGGTKRQKSY
ncbi:hypothetical protein FDECE_6514 [Fusarium decemcellulare]|nr:hypothetical protein FDECE_6514 [Fusarium decemcellulare]